MISRLGGMTGIFVAVSAHATPVCDSVSECLELAPAVRAQDFQPVVKLGPIVKTADGQAFRMTQRDAEKYCASKGTRLPTAKEFALALNSKGVYESPVNDVEIFQIFKQDGSFDFSYDSRTYTRPENDDVNHYFWTSSIWPGFNSEIALYFDGKNGSIGPTDREIGTIVAVSCVAR